MPAAHPHSRPAQRFAGALLLMVAGGGCVGEPEPGEYLRLPGLQAEPQDAESRTVLSDALAATRLGTGAYRVPGWDGRILLTNGQWEDAASRAFAQLSRGLHVQGDFDGDGETEAATLLTLGAGGMDLRVYLLGVGSVGGRISQEAATLLGERVQVVGLESRDGWLEVDLLTFGPGDNPCCPSRPVTRRYKIRGGKWVQR